MGTSSKELAQKLKKLAKRQHGCFTAAQALEAGYADSVHLYHVKTGNWVREFRGVYRLASQAETPEARCMAALLWTRDKRGKIQGFLTEATTLALQQDTLGPDQPIQIGVPKGFRRSSVVPDDIQIITVSKEDHKTSKFNGLRVQESIDIPAPPIQMEMDAPDYYDWLDYQAVLCAKKG
jgi:Transcriptional regulator, AbiEi antitoxin